MSFRTMHISQDAHANTLAINKDASQVVIAGRNIFKIFSIEDEEIVEKMNLRVGKNMNLNYSTGDVVWNHTDDNILATAATNGSVVTWRLDKPSISKLDMVFQDHRRTVNKVNFHPTEAHLLISGSQDGTMKLFDLRKKEVTVTFYSNAESVRDVEFNNFQHYMFAAVQENGNVQLWDLRRTDRCERQFTAHSGPVFACDWHPEDRRWLATAGRDKTIKVWDMSSSKPSVDYTIQTIAPVARVKWRPQRKFHIASSALVMDFTINVWDIRRPYIPFAAFGEHKDVTTGIIWRHDPHVFLSTSKDNTLYQHTFKDAVRPADRAYPIGLDINCTGDLCLAISDKLLTENPVGKENYSATRLPAFFRKSHNREEQFRAVFSSLQVFNNSGEKQLSAKWFVQSATRYQLTGRSVPDICEHNSTVARSLERLQEATTWNILKLMYSCTLPIPCSDLTKSSPLDGHRPADLDRGIPILDATLLPESTLNDQRSSRHQSGSNHRHHSGERQPGDISTGFSEDETETDDTDHDWAVNNMTSGMAYNQTDFFFGEGDGFSMQGMAPMEDTSMINGVLTLDEKLKMIDWQLPVEAFQPRHDFTDRASPPDHLLDFYPGEEDDEALEKTSGVGINTIRSDVEDQMQSLTTDPSAHIVPSWDCTPIVLDMIHFYASQGDVQMSVSVLIVLGDLIKNHIDEQIQEEWYNVYLELLTRFQLFTVATEVIKLSPLPNISAMNQQSTSIHTNCRCGRALGRLDWLCERCKARSNICAVCHQAVKGLYVWCQGCAHGGHLLHIQEWMKTNRSCPVGCGHLCQYT